MKQIKWWSTVTRLIKTPSIKTKISEAIKFETKKHNDKHKDNKDDFITSNLNPTMQGTTLDILLSWHLIGKILIDKFGTINKYGKIDKTDFLKTHRKEHIEKYEDFLQLSKKEINIHKINNEFLIFFAIISAVGTSIFRAGYEHTSNTFFQIIAFIWEQEQEEEGKFNNFTNFLKIKRAMKNSKFDLINKINESMQTLLLLNKRVEKKANQIKAKAHFINDNPEFGYEYYGIKGDGDYLYDNVLGDVKSTKNWKIEKNQITQMLLYKLLNDKKIEHKQPFTFDIKEFEIYNPLWNITHNIKVKNIEVDWKELDKVLLDEKIKYFGE